MGRWGKSGPPRDLIPGPSILQRVAIPTELSRPNLADIIIKWTSFPAISISFPHVHPFIFLKSHTFFRKIGRERVETSFHISNLWPVKQHRRELMWFYIPNNVLSGHTSGYHGAGTKADRDNRSRQLNPQDPKYQGPDTKANRDNHSRQLNPQDSKYHGKKYWE